MCKALTVLSGAIFVGVQEGSSSLMPALMSIDADSSPSPHSTADGGMTHSSLWQMTFAVDAEGSSLMTTNTDVDLKDWEGVLPRSDSTPLRLAAAR
jgi:hypothetical protein